eukprot:CAMPEP_0115186196 /NCGR_PEP_ID=MMETSP0270-20121206/9859_1 /TAXON_ID=71861 /ORGANISM="Scrippsiella trochoidea, Strain CCMP3099" /LENGTH=725 /DNA_ID=CAMNT_0002599317 /DNA_START=57 /DNA_END=2234 /DNA_ORIENTATION=-
MTAAPLHAMELSGSRTSRTSVGSIGSCRWHDGGTFAEIVNPELVDAIDGEGRIRHSKPRRSKSGNRRRSKTTKTRWAARDSWKNWGEDCSMYRGSDGGRSTPLSGGIGDDGRFHAEVVGVSHMAVQGLRNHHDFNGTGAGDSRQVFEIAGQRESRHSQYSEAMMSAPSSSSALRAKPKLILGDGAASAKAESALPDPVQSHLRTLSDDLGKLLNALEPQVSASRKLENELVVLRDNIKLMCSQEGAGAHFKGSSSSHEEAMQPDSYRSSESQRFSRRFERQQAMRLTYDSDGSMVESITDSNEKKAAEMGKFGKGKSRKPLIPHIDDIKQEIRERAGKKSYSVCTKYHTVGICQKIARSQWFDSVTMTVIILNAIWIAIDADYNTAASIYDAALVFQIAENLFCSYFLFELLIRFGAFRRKLDCFHDFWFNFDAVMLAMIIFETWVVLLFMAFSWQGDQDGLSLLRLVRLMRLFRIAKVSRVVLAMPELVVLINGLKMGCRAVTASLSLIGIIIYVFAIMFRTLSHNTDLEEKFFASIPAAMVTLLLTAVLPDHTDYFTEDFGPHPIYFGLLYFVFIMLIAYVVLNLLVGVLVNVATLVAEQDQEESRISLMREEIGETLEPLGVQSNTISPEKFQALIIKPRFCNILNQMGVDPVSLIENAEHHFQKRGGKMRVGALQELVLQLRGSNVATVRDLVDSRRHIARMFKLLEEHLACREEKLAIAR